MNKIAPYEILDIQTCPNCGYLIRHNNQEYIADITCRSDIDYRTEFAVFKAIDGQITFENALPIYKIMDVGFDFGALEKCIQEFIKYINN